MESPLSFGQRLVVSVVALALAFGICVLVSERFGSEVVVRDHRVTVVNQESVENDDRRFSFGDECVLRPHGKVARRLWPRDVELMEYRAPKDKHVFDNWCPSGTIFLEPLYQD